MLELLLPAAELLELKEAEPLIDCPEDRLMSALRETRALGDKEAREEGVQLALALLLGLEARLELAPAEALPEAVCKAESEAPGV